MKHLTLFFIILAAILVAFGVVDAVLRYRAAEQEIAEMEAQTEALKRQGAALAEDQRATEQLRKRILTEQIIREQKKN